MADRKGVIEGLTILEKYAGGDKFCAAVREIFYSGVSGDAPVSEKDRERLEELRWSVDRESGVWATFP